MLDFTRIKPGDLIFSLFLDGEINRLYVVIKSDYDLVRNEFLGEAYLILDNSYYHPRRNEVLHLVEPIGNFLKISDRTWTLAF